MTHAAANTATVTMKALLSPWVGQQVGPQTVSSRLVMRDRPLSLSSSNVQYSPVLW